MSWITEYILYWIQSLALKIIRIIRIFHIPKHVAFIMDGNRRYARKNLITKLASHTKGFDRLMKMLQWCIYLGIMEVTVYSFSIENFKRSKEEVELLMQLTKEKFENFLKERHKLMEKGICIRVIGNFSLIAEDIRKLIAKIMIITKNNNKIFLNIAFAYTSRDEITCAIKNIIKGVKHNEILLEDINEDLISKCLYTYNSPNPDLLIRTSGETRLSDFLMWQTSDTCIYFADILWPEFSTWNFLSAIFYYQRYYFDLQRIAKMQNLRPIMDNDRVSMYVNKLHHEHQVMLENMCQ